MSYKTPFVIIHSHWLIVAEDEFTVMLSFWQPMHGVMFFPREKKRSLKTTMHFFLYRFIYLIGTFHLCQIDRHSCEGEYTEDERKLFEHSRMALKSGIICRIPCTLFIR